MTNLAFSHLFYFSHVGHVGLLAGIYLLVKLRYSNDDGKLKEEEPLMSIVPLNNFFLTINKSWYITGVSKNNMNWKAYQKLIQHVLVQYLVDWWVYHCYEDHMKLQQRPHRIMPLETLTCRKLISMVQLYQVMRLSEI